MPGCRRPAGLSATVLLLYLCLPGRPAPGSSPVAAAVDPRHAVTPATVRLNEVLYDVPGADQGHEFVELIHIGTQPIALAGLALERGNGSRPDDWRRIWSGAAADTLRPGGRYVVGGGHVVPLPDAVVELGLQNGPDACRLLHVDEVIDLLGWGEHVHAEYSAGPPAPGVPAGTSLGRLPDGRDTGCNACDWQPLAAASPGAANRPRPPFRIECRGHRSLGQGVYAVELEWRLRAVTTALSPVIQLIANDCGSAQVLAAASDIAVDDPDEAAGTLVLPQLPPGSRELCLVARTPEHADTLRTLIRAGPGSLRITEIMARPAAGAPEWVEVLNRGPAPVALDSFALADARLEPVMLVGGDLAGDAADDGNAGTLLAPGELVVLADGSLTADAPVLVLDDWPTLNDTGDRVRLIDLRGRTTDDVVYEADWAPAGASIERLDSDLPSEDPASWVPRAGGSAGRIEPARMVNDAGFLSLERPASAGGPLLLRLASPLRDGSLRIFRLDGRPVLEVTGSALVGRSQWVWSRRDADGVELPPGAYLIQLEGRRWHDERPVVARVTAAWIDR